MKNDCEELLIRIDNLKEILNELLGLESLNSDEIIKLSKELDYLIVEYLRLTNKNK